MIMDIQDLHVAGPIQDKGCPDPIELKRDGQIGKSQHALECDISLGKKGVEVGQ
jgi:hypothetical protein